MSSQYTSSGYKTAVTSSNRPVAVKASQSPGRLPVQYLSQEVTDQYKGALAFKPVTKGCFCSSQLCCLCQVSGDPATKRRGDFLKGTDQGNIKYCNLEELGSRINRKTGARRKATTEKKGGHVRLHKPFGRTNWEAVSTVKPARAERRQLKKRGGTLLCTATCGVAFSTSTLAPEHVLALRARAPCASNNSGDLQDADAFTASESSTAPARSRPSLTAASSLACRRLPRHCCRDQGVGRRVRAARQRRDEFRRQCIARNFYKLLVYVAWLIRVQLN
ncbi:hypothetical protein GGX14DRAFT_384009 [Mycena pura]|uniref:Uncharacterized protein n=1 Tax=Mycena pura TaxID=153505 RepID=A0AAD6YUJ6_9AGAR|nr:hypothetical protein GGX14DRAFT_384009 [Mycena pura]